MSAREWHGSYRRCRGQLIPLVLCAALSLTWSGHAQAALGVITGRIVNEATGDGLAKVNVVASVADRYTVNEPMPGCVSLSDGSFRLDHVRPGGYLLSVRKPGFSVRNPAADLLLTVKEGDTIGPLQISLAPNADVRGKVVDENGMPQTGISVYALRRDPEFSVATENPSSGRASTDRSGGYSLRALPDGNYYLLAVPEHTAETGKGTKPLSLGFYPDVTRAIDAVPISVTAGQSISADIQLHREARHSVQGSISDLPVGLSLKDVWLEMTPLDCPLSELRRGISLTHRGTFVIADVASGRYELRLRRMNERHGVVTLGRAEIVVRTEDVHDVSVVCFPPTTVHAHAAFENGVASPASPTVLMLHGHSMVYSSRFGPTGAIDFPAVEPGQYWVGVELLPPGYYVSSVTMMKQEARNRAIDLTGAGTADVEVTLRSGAGTITASSGSFPSVAILEPAVLSPDGTNVQIQPVKEGMPVVFQNLPPGDYLLYSAIPMSYEIWRNPDFLAAVKNRATVVHLEENGSEQVQLPVIDESVIRASARQLGLDYQ